MLFDSWPHQFLSYVVVEPNHFLGATFTLLVPLPHVFLENATYVWPHLNSLPSALPLTLSTEVYVTPLLSLMCLSPARLSILASGWNSVLLTQCYVIICKQCPCILSRVYTVKSQSRFVSKTLELNLGHWDWVSRVMLILFGSTQPCLKSRI